MTAHEDDSHEIAEQSQPTDQKPDNAQAPETGAEPETEADPDSVTERPDPSEVPDLKRSETIHQRDEQGQLLPDEGVIEMPQGFRRVKHKPLTRGLLNRFEQEFDGKEVDWDEMDQAIADFYIKPSYDADELDDMDPGVYITLMMFIVEKVKGDIDDEITSQLAEEVEQRQENSSGN